eukprot:384578-Pelagomonas_calceolata.AAC.1
MEPTAAEHAVDNARGVHRQEEDQVQGPVSQNPPAFSAQYNKCESAHCTARHLSPYNIRKDDMQRKESKRPDTPGPAPCVTARSPDEQASQGLTTTQDDLQTFLCQPE